MKIYFTLGLMAIVFLSSASFANAADEYIAITSFAPEGIVEKGKSYEVEWDYKNISKNSVVNAFITDDRNFCKVGSTKIKDKKMKITIKESKECGYDETLFHELVLYVDGSSSDPSIAKAWSNKFVISHVPIKLSSQNEGKSWRVGKTYTVKFELPSKKDAAIIILEKYHSFMSAKAGTVNESRIIGTTKEGKTSFKYKVTNDAFSMQPWDSSLYKIKVCTILDQCLNNSAESARYFNIKN